MISNFQVKSGLLNIDKPQGITSYDVVDVLKKIFPKTKIGHTGTLDPLATGVLQICIGEATRLTNYLMNQEKKYHVKMLLGVETDTYDITGRIVFASVVNSDEIYIKERIKRFVGKQMQIPPIYSAIRVEGKRAYQYAREGNTVEISPREIEIFSIENIKVDLDKKEIEFDTHCTKGTYIRSLVNDIGKKIGCGATMVELRRLSNGSFNIEDSIKLYEFLGLDYEDMVSKVISIEEYYNELKKIDLSEEDYVRFLNGVKLTYNEQNKLVRIYKNKKYVGLGTIENEYLKRFIIE
ncbi:MAG: tRNA pseudouridine(55) synthase TruB [Clostridia bacterium]|nr:tRNA pseudouridine(55) synthase TruB [Clostridia bacterium]